MPLVDLSMTVGPHWRWPVRTESVLDHKRGDAWQSTIVSLPAHAFTHIDAPLHMMAGGQTIDDVAVERLCGSAAILDLSFVGANRPIDASDLRRAGEHIRPGDIVILKTEWDRKRSWMSREYWTEAPYVQRDAAVWLAEQELKAVGFDFPQDQVIREIPLRHPDVPEMPTHDIILRKGIYLLEYLVNLGCVPGKRVTVFALPLKLRAVEAAPARVIAVFD